jgi:uncharacterized protein
MSNPVVQWQIVAKDPDAVARFYRKLFGWKISTNNALGYREVAAEEGGVPGGIWPAPPEAHNFVQLFVAVQDIEQAVQDATQLGARVIVPPSALPEGGTMAVLLDPSGMPFCVTRRVSG